MEKTSIDRQYDEILSDISGGKLLDALKALRQFSRMIPAADYYYLLENLEDNYHNLVKYAFDGYDDPKRDEILDNLSVSLLEVADDIHYALREKETVQTRLEKALVAREFGDDSATISEKIDSLIFGREVERVLEETGNEKTPYLPVERLFKLIWLTRKWSDDLYDKFRSLLHSDKLEWHEKASWFQLPRSASLIISIPISSFSSWMPSSHGSLRCITAAWSVWSLR